MEQPPERVESDGILFSVPEDVACMGRHGMVLAVSVLPVQPEL